MLNTFKSDLRLLLKYSQLFPLCFAVFVSMLGFGLVMPILPVYARDLGATGLQLGFLTTSFAITRAIITFPGGWLSDRIGRKKPVILGLFAYSIVMALYGFSSDVNHLIILRALQGAASGIVWPVINTMIVDIVKVEDRSKALGLYEMMWFLGMVVGPGLGGILADAFTIAVPFFVCGFLALLSMFLVIFKTKETVSMRSSSKGEEAQREQSIQKNYFKKLTLYPIIFVGLCVSRFIIGFSDSLIQPVLSAYANEVLFIPKAGVGLLFTAMGGATLFTTLPMGVAADKIGRKPILIFGKLLDVVSAVLIIFSRSFYPLLFVMMLRGFGRSFVNPSITAMFSSITSTSYMGRSMGIFNTFQNVGLIVGSTLGGLFYDYSYEIPFIACAVAGLTGIVVVLLMVKEQKPTEPH